MIHLNRVLRVQQASKRRLLVASTKNNNNTISNTTSYYYTFLTRRSNHHVLVTSHASFSSLLSSSNHSQSLLGVTRVNNNNSNGTTITSHHHNPTTTSRQFSDNLLGYNPMAQQHHHHKPIIQPPPPSSKNKPSPSNQNDDEKKPHGPFIGTDSNTKGGGVWAQTSAKRDKLGELKMELKHDLNQYTLDDMATEEEKLDLFLVDGVHSIVTMIDYGGVYGDLNLNLDSNLNLNDGSSYDDDAIIENIMKDFIQKKETDIASTNNSTTSLMVTKEEYERLFHKMIEKVKAIREVHPVTPKPYHTFSDISTDDASNNSDEANSTSQQQQQQKQQQQPSALLNIRDFLFYDQPNPDEPIPTNLRKSLHEPISKPFVQCHEYFQLLLVQNALEHLSTQWEELTKISSADQDRAATRGETLDNVKTLDIKKVHDVLKSYAFGSCSDRVEALWKLVDRDNDGMLDQEEMDGIIYMSIKPMEGALKMFIEDCIEVWPLRKMGLPPPPTLDGEVETNGAIVDDDDDDDDDDDRESKKKKKKLGFYARWKQERKEKLAKKLLLKLVDRTIQKHFDIEVEIAHRLRCVYAFAEKKHQDGKIESVLVDANADNSGSGAFSIGSRKRYVELEPKISHSEFLEEQKKTFPHLDRIGQELCTSLKEDLWVHQGRQRQNQELKRETLAFLAVVGVIDYFVTIN